MGNKKSMSRTLGEFLRLQPIPPLCKMDQFNNCYGGRRSGGGWFIVKQNGLVDASRQLIIN